MAQNATHQILDDKKPCVQWAEKGHCVNGDRCRHEHHNNLHPSSHQKVHPDFVVPDSLGTSCNRCLQKQLQCDKAGRDAGSEDPCSECRWFAGADNAQPCVASQTSSVNDELWRIMMNSPQTGYMLPEQTHRLATPKSKTRKDRTPGPVKAAPVPIADHKVKAGWQGKSKEELVDMPSWIPQDVREHPRAYLVPGRESVKATKAHARFEARVEARAKQNTTQSTGSKRPRENSTTSQSQSFLPVLPTPARPAADAVNGRCVECRYDYEKSVWQFIYENGTSISVATQVPNAAPAPTHRPERQNDPREKRPRLEPQPTQERSDGELLWPARLPPASD